MVVRLSLHAGCLGHCLGTSKSKKWRGFLRKRMDTGKETQNMLLNGNFNSLKKSYHTTFICQDEKYLFSF